MPGNQHASDGAGDELRKKREREKERVFIKKLPINRNAATRLAYKWAAPCAPRTGSALLSHFQRWIPHL